MVAVVPAVALLPVTAGSSATPASQAPADRYIVVLRDDVANPRQVANEMAGQYGLSVTHVYEHALKGFAARISPEQLPAVRADSRVQYVAEDQEVQVFS